MYEKKRCINNIYEIAKKRGIKIGELEDSCGVSRGYLSRVNKPDYPGSPPIEVIDAIANRLNIGIDYLVNYDGSVYNDDDRFLMKTFDTLQRLTDSISLQWVCETEDVLMNYRPDRDNNPFMNYVAPISEDGEGHYEYNSRFIMGRVLINGDCYHADLHDGGEDGVNSFVYLNSVAYMNKEDRFPAIEFYVVKGDMIEPICSTAFMRSAPKAALMKLYSSADIVHGMQHILGPGRRILERFIEKSDYHQEGE